MVLRSQILVHKQTLPTAEQALPGRDTPVTVAARHAVNGHPLQSPFPAGMQQAVFAMGCFWGAERRFWQQSGVYSSAAGYAGGHTPNPTYEEVCSGLTGHTEVVLVVFDPQVTSYAALLKVFWEAHNPTHAPRQRQWQPVPLGHLLPRQRAIERCVGQPSALSAGAGNRRLGPDHHRNRCRTGFLLCRGLSPAIPGQEPRRLLRAGRYWRVSAGVSSGTRAIS